MSGQELKKQGKGRRRKEKKSGNYYKHKGGRSKIATLPWWGGRSRNPTSKIHGRLPIRQFRERQAKQSFLVLPHKPINAHIPTYSFLTCSADNSLGRTQMFRVSRGNLCNSTSFLVSSRFDDGSRASKTLGSVFVHLSQIPPNGQYKGC